MNTIKNQCQKNHPLHFQSFLGKFSLRSHYRRNGWFRLHKRRQSFINRPNSFKPTRACQSAQCAGTARRDHFELLFTMMSRLLFAVILIITSCYGQFTAELAPNFVEKLILFSQNSKESSISGNQSLKSTTVIIKSLQ